MNTSAADLAKFFVAIQKETLLPRAKLDRMWTPSTPKYGLGWTVSEVRGRKAVGHEGGGCAWVTHLPEEQITAIALSNLAGARADETTDEIAASFL